MVDFKRARMHMVDSQLQAGGVIDARLLARMGAVAREEFVPESRRALAYIDAIHWFGSTGTSRFMPAPAVLARLLQLAAIAETDSVLDIGASTGYGVAVIAGLAAEVVGLEPDAALAAAGAGLQHAGGLLANCRLISGPVAALGAERFDVVIVEGALEEVREDYLAALREGGRLVAVIGTGGLGVAHVFVKAEGKVTARSEFDAALPPLFPPAGEPAFRF